MAKSSLDLKFHQRVISIYLWFYNWKEQEMLETIIKCLFCAVCFHLRYVFLAYLNVFLSKLSTQEFLRNSLLAGVTVLEICSFSMFISTATFDHEDNCIMDSFSKSFITINYFMESFCRNKDVWKNGNLFAKLPLWSFN